MPRELKPVTLTDEPSEAVSPPIVKSPEGLDEEGMEGEMTIEDILAQQNPKRDEVHPYTQTLKPSDIESCILIENETFPPQERCTREKFQYRLSKCPELALGIFTSAEDGDNIVTAETSQPVYSGAPQRKAVLLGHIVATKTNNNTVHDEDMDVPTAEKPDVGHREEGATVCIHSLAVLPAYQGRGLGKTLVKAYVHRMESQGVALRIALIAHEALIPFYESLGFENRGKSAAQFAGGGWFDMVRELKTEAEIEAEEEDFELDV